MNIQIYFLFLYLGIFLILFLYHFMCFLGRKYDINNLSYSILNLAIALHLIVSRLLILYFKNDININVPLNNHVSSRKFFYVFYVYIL